MSRQQQDLVLFRNQNLFPEEILTSNSSSLSIVSHLQGTSPSWLINSLVENCLQGTASLVNKDLTTKQAKRAEVIHISFNYPKDYHVQNCKKNGLDLATISNYHYIDCFSELFSKHIKNPHDAADDVEILFGSIEKQLSAISTPKKVIFVEEPEILLAATNTSANELLLQLHKLNKACRHMSVIVSQNAPMINPESGNPHDPSFKTAEFLTKLYHRSQLNINLQPLPTGRASDITGCVTISSGAVPFESIEPKVKVVETEYIYHISKELSIKLFFR